jgi:hypothetical protein
MPPSRLLLQTTCTPVPRSPHPEESPAERKRGSSAGVNTKCVALPAGGGFPSSS